MENLKKYKAIKKRLGLTDEDVARMFGYKSGVAFANSARREKVIAGIVAMWERIGKVFDLNGL